MEGNPVAEQFDDILVAAKDDTQFLGGGGWNKINPDLLKKNLDKLISSLGHSLNPAAASQTGFRVSEVSVAVTISASGQVGILGTGFEAGAEASLTLTLTPRE